MANRKTTEDQSIFHLPIMKYLEHFSIKSRFQCDAEYIQFLDECFFCFYTIRNDFSLCATFFWYIFKILQEISFSYCDMFHNCLYCCFNIYVIPYCNIFCHTDFLLCSLNTLPLAPFRNGMASCNQINVLNKVKKKSDLISWNIPTLLFLHVKMLRLTSLTT